MGAELFHAHIKTEGRTDDKVNSPFRNFVNSPKKY